MTEQQASTLEHDVLCERIIISINGENAYSTCDCLERENATLRLALLLLERERCAKVCNKIKLERSGILHARNKTELATMAFDTALDCELAIRALPDPCDLTEARATLLRFAELLAVMECDDVEEAAAEWREMMKSSLDAANAIKTGEAWNANAWPSLRDRALFIALRDRLAELEKHAEAMANRLLAFSENDSYLRAYEQWKESGR